MQYVYLKDGGGDPFTVGFYDPTGDWHPESDHDSPEEAAKRVRFLNGGTESESPEPVLHLTITGMSICGTKPGPNDSKADKLSSVTCLECLRLKALALPPGSMTVAQAVESMRHEYFEDQHRAIGIDISIHDKSIEIQFNVYDGREHFYGATLEGAVQSCLVSNNMFSGSQDEADRIIREAMAYQEQRL